MFRNQTIVTLVCSGLVLCAAATCLPACQDVAQHSPTYPPAPTVAQLYTPPPESAPPPTSVPNPSPVLTSAPTVSPTTHPNANPQTQLWTQMPTAERIEHTLLGGRQILIQTQPAADALSPFTSGISSIAVRTLAEILGIGALLFQSLRVKRKDTELTESNNALNHLNEVIPKGVYETATNAGVRTTLERVTGI